MSSKHEPVSKKHMERDVDSGWAWVVVSASFVSSGIYSGLYYTFSIYYDLLLIEFESTRSLTALIGSIFTSVCMLSGPLAGRVIEKIGPRSAVMLGGVLVMIGFAASSLATNLVTLYFTFGVVAGFGCCLNTMGFILALSTSFKRRYSMALSVSQAGIGVGLFFFSPLFKWLTAEFGWRGSFLISGAVGFHFTVLGALIFPPRRSRERNVLLESDQKVEVSEEDQDAPKNAFYRNIGFRREILNHSSVFFWLLASTFLFTFMGDIATSKSLDEYFIYTLQAIAVGNLSGRLLVGPLIGYCSINPITLFGVSQIVGALSIVLFTAVFNGVQLVAQAFVFGMTYGCQNVLYILVPRYIFGDRNLTTVFGRARFFGGVGTLIGPPVAALLLDATDSYIVVYVFGGLAECVAAVCTFCLFLGPPILNGSQPPA